jgi:hypothetical protein
MDEAIKILKHAEVVLMKKIKSLKDGKPKYLASEKLQELRHAITVLKQANLDEEFAEMDEKEEDELLKQIFTNRPPTAQA